MTVKLRWQLVTSVVKSRENESMKDYTQFPPPFVKSLGSPTSGMVSSSRGRFSFLSKANQDNPERHVHRLMQITTY